MYETNDKLFGIAMIDDNIYKYDNYRHILRDFYQDQKSKYPQKFSYRYFSKLVGYKTSNFILLVINNKRNISHNSIKQFARVLKLRGRKYDYFESLVYFNQAAEDTTKARYFEKLTSFKEYKEARLVDDSQNLYFSKWYYPVIREMIRLSDFRPDFIWISKNIFPRIKVAQVKEALETLETLRLIKRLPNGSYIQNDQQLKTRNQGLGNEIAEFHKKMIQIGYNSLNRPPDKRDVSGITMSLSPAKFMLIRKKISEFRDEIQSVIDERIDSETINEITPDIETKPYTKQLINSMVCQLNIQFFELVGLGNDD